MKKDKKQVVPANDTSDADTIAQTNASQSINNEEIEAVSSRIIIDRKVKSSTILCAEKLEFTLSQK